MTETWIVFFTVFAISLKHVFLLFIIFSLQVVLKVVKHCQEEGSGGTDLVQGVLLGLVEGNRLEVTNCFPFPRHAEEEDFDESMLKEKC